MCLKPKAAISKRVIASLTGFLLGLFCPHLPAQTYVSIQPDNQGQLITGWGFDIPGSSSLTNLNIIPSSSRTNVFYRLRSP